MKFRTPVLGAALIGALALPGAASAAVTQTQITSPSENVFRIYDDDKPAADPSNTFTVSGTSNGAEGDALELRCFSSNENGSVSSDFFASTTVAAGGGFTFTVVDRSTDDQTCRMRAVPDSYSNVDLADFKGPAANIAYYETYDRQVSGPAGTTARTDYYVSTGGLRGGLDWGSVADCGPYGWYAYINPSFAQTGSEGFDCALSLFNSNGSTTNRRSEIKVDGKNALAPDALPDQQDPDAGGPLVGGEPAGSPSIVASITRSGEDVTTVAEEPISFCGADATYPGNDTNCPQAVSAGVSLKRTTTMADGGLKALVTDVWSSTDGAAHALDLQYETYNNSDNGPAFLFGGESAFSVFAGGDEPSLGAAVPGSIIARDREVDDGQESSATAETYLQQPQGVRFVDDQYYLESYQATVPAGGSITYRWVLQTRRTGPEAVAAAKQAEDAADVPKVAITAPASGSAVQDAAVTVTGTASDNGGLKGLTVNGAPVAVANGAFSTPVTLSPGANTITAVATDNAGNTSTATAAVTFVPRAAPTPPRPGTTPVAARLCKVPSIKRGSTYGSARSKIRRANCAVGKVTRVRSRTKKGRVVSVSPSSGSSRPAGTKVSVKLSSGPAKKKSSRR